eukprot:TRINITY_DN22320_c0_g1_i1.p1 TRINITY_DN22320_c0_g1~~TRINITY_DN22320_c0_g1_i1.p1  ORF type:complete len:380 (+),score=25.04 TRINITY_DN22320_c0_g1_i1:39-1142(+)
MEDPTVAEKKYIFSKNMDMVAHVLPIIAGAVVAPFMWMYVDKNSMPLWGYLFIVVFCDVGHVWGTIFRCYLDTAENKRRWALYNLTPVAVFVTTFVLHYWVSVGLCWMVIGYIAIFHFIRQQWGFLCLYRARAGESTDYNIDRMAHLSGALCPILLWHSDRDRTFDWFMREDPFLVSVPAGSYPFIVACYACIFVAYYARAYACGKIALSPMKYLVMSFCWLTWLIGILLPHKLIAVFFLNMFHAAPSYMIVFFTARNKWSIHEPPTDAERLIKYLVKPGNWWVYLLFFVVIAVIEESLWEAFVWRDYFPNSFTFEVNHLGKSFFTSLLSLPQTTHYVLDAFIWKLSQNPGLGDYYGLTYTVPVKDL